MEIKVCRKRMSSIGQIYSICAKLIRVTCKIICCKEFHLCGADNRAENHCSLNESCLLMDIANRKIINIPTAAVVVIIRTETETDHNLLVCIV